LAASGAANASAIASVSARRSLGELARDELKIAFDQSEVGSRAIGLAQRQDVFV
jgi:hypothetical protein